MDDKRKHVLVVAEAQSYLVLNIKEKMVEEGLDVTLIHSTMEDINSVKMQTIDAIVIFVEEQLLSEQPPIVLLKDRAVEFEKPIFLIGDMVDLNEIEELIPRTSIEKSFARPINIVHILQDLNTFFNKQTEESDKKHILVVDDSGTMLRMLKSWLSDKYSVILANSGMMAIKYLTLNRPDLILLDYEMPICDGKQVLEMIRSELQFADIPVIFLTGKSDRETVMGVMSLKPEGYLLKNMDQTQIVKAIDTFFAKQKMKESM